MEASRKLHYFRATGVDAVTRRGEVQRGRTRISVMCQISTFETDSNRCLLFCSLSLSLAALYCPRTTEEDKDVFSKRSPTLENHKTCKQYFKI